MCQKRQDLGEVEKLVDTLFSFYDTLVFEDQPPFAACIETARTLQTCRRVYFSFSSIIVVSTFVHQRFATTSLISLPSWLVSPFLALNSPSSSSH